MVELVMVVGTIQTKHFRLVYQHFKLLTSSPSLLPTPRSGNQLYDEWVFHHASCHGRSNRRQKPACGNLHASQRPGPSQAQGNLLALHLQLTVECLWNFDVDLIQSLVTVLEAHQKIVMSSDVLKKGTLLQDQIEWTNS